MAKPRETVRSALSHVPIVVVLIRSRAPQIAASKVIEKKTVSVSAEDTQTGIEIIQTPPKTVPSSNNISPDPSLLHSPIHKIVDTVAGGH